MPAQDDKMDKFIRSRLTDPSDSAQIKKVTEGLVRRGYSWGDIKEALERFKAEAEDDGWSEQ
jgi:SOS response regulatory protein OraA/RecX